MKQAIIDLLFFSLKILSKKKGYKNIIKWQLFINSFRIQKNKCRNTERPKFRYFYKL
jgi:hypothetical protein